MNPQLHFRKEGCPTTFDYLVKNVINAELYVHSAMMLEQKKYKLNHASITFLNLAKSFEFTEHA